MRIIGDYPHPFLKITMFEWNNRYLLKFETNKLEQTYKVKQEDVAEQDVLKLFTPEFIREVELRFDEMEQSLLRNLSAL